MLNTPMDIQKLFPVRKSAKQKNAFRDAVVPYAERMGYQVKVEKGAFFGDHNMVIGNPDTARYLITAHYDTPARILLPNLICPCNLPLFILWQLVVSLVYLVPVIILGLVVGKFFQSPLIGKAVYLITLFGSLYMIMAGPANPTNANDNTSGTVTVLEIMRTLPENLRDKVCFVLFDLEELGTLGSLSYASRHKKAVKNQVVLNLDCVGDGDELMFLVGGKLRKDKQRMAALYSGAGRFGTKTVTIWDKSSVYPSDQANFPYGVGIASLTRKKGLLYADKIHTPKDTCLDETNVNILRAAITTIVSQDA